jgi:outer membrane receptor protein involved in Fe transport
MRTKGFLLPFFLATAATAQQPTAVPPEPTPAVPQPQAEAPAAPTPPAIDAKSPPPAAEPPASRRNAEEAITVTGSRIRRKDLTTAAPVTVISRTQISASGKITIGDFLQSLPEQGNAINTQVNNGGNGTTRVNLRGLGTDRTLVLFNGRRFVPGGSGADSAVDLNSIPTAVIERVEVLKDGASAVYGSDAIAGVVNIITRRKMTGTEVSAYAGTSGHGDGTIYDLSATTGASSESTNAIFSVGFNKIKPIFAAERAFSTIPRAYDSTTGEYSQGSQTTPQATIVLPLCTSDAARNKRVGCVGTQIDNPNNDPRITLYNQMVATYKTDQTFIRDPSNLQFGYRPFGTTQLFPAGDGFNFQPDNYLVTPQQRISVFASGDTNLGNVARAFFESSYVNRQSAQLLAAEPLGTSGESVVVSGASVYNPFGRDFTSVNRRLVEFGRRGRTEDIDTFRVVGGLDGTLPQSFGPLHGWVWEVNGNYGRTQGDTVKSGSLMRGALQKAIGPSYLDANGVARCGTKAAPIADCVPLNLFGNSGSIPQEQVSGLLFTGTQRGITQLIAIQANAGGDVITLYGDKPVGLAVGYEYRQMLGASIPDPVTVAGDTTGNKGQITQGSFYVNEGYAELSIPILANAPFVETLEASAAARVFNYSNFGSDATYKFGGRWMVIRDLTLRGTFSTAFRAPSVSDLYFGLADSFPNVKDPCAAATAPASCGAAQGNKDPSSQLRTQVGGNPNLKPETAKIYTIGAVIEPSAVKNLSVTVDYYNITVNNSIRSYGASLILNKCYLGDATSAAQFCPLITRDPITQRVSNISDLNVNVGRDLTAGIDVAVRYALPTEAGRFGFIFDGTWLQRFDRVLADGTVIHGKGTFDIATTGGVYPEWKFNTGVTWALGGFAAGFSTRFLSAFRECGTASGDFAGRGKCYPSGVYPYPHLDSRRVSAYSTSDIFVSYSLTSAAGRTVLAAGMLNIFDKQPAVIYNGFTGASDPTAYDFVGRYPYARVSHTF